jgi:hypothetical protein
MTVYELDGQIPNVDRIRRFSVELLRFLYAVSASYPMAATGKAVGA